MLVTFASRELTNGADEARADSALALRRPRVRRSFDDAPLLVYWEMTRACDLSCRHCRASTQSLCASDELTRAEGRSLVDELAAMGNPRPILILTGGDCLKRPDFMDLVRYAATRNVALAVAATLSERLDEHVLHALRQHGVKTVSLTIDGAASATHDGVRGIDGHFNATLDTIALLRQCGFTVQVNTTVLATNVEQLADIAVLMHELGVNVWELFFLVANDRGTRALATTAQENEDICNFLVDASRYGFEVRAAEAPFLRRVAATRRANEGVAPDASSGPLYGRLRRRLTSELGEPFYPPRLTSARTRDGQGTVFVAANGDVHPSALCNVRLGSLREQSLGEIYREHKLLKQIRNAEFVGVCGACAYAQHCGGSRARAFATTGDPLGSDPGCLVVCSAVHPAPE
jgi:radical SAM protein